MTALIIAGELPSDAVEYLAPMLTASERMGWTVHYAPNAGAVLSAWLHDEEACAVDGIPSVALDVAANWKRRLVGPSSDWFVAVPPELLSKAHTIYKREGRYDQTSLVEQIGWYGIFGEPQLHDAWFYVRVLDRKLISLGILGRADSPNVGGFPLPGTAPSPMTPEEEAAVRSFVEGLLQRIDLQLPPAFGAMIASQDHRLTINEMFSALDDVTIDGDWISHLELLRGAWRTREELSPGDERWELHWHEGLLVHPGWTPPSKLPFRYPGSIGDP